MDKNSNLSIFFDVIIFGAGPAGISAGLKLVENHKKVLILEKENLVGGISKTLEFQGCRFDLGGHRFFSKSPEVNDLWDKTLGNDFLTRPRLSRIYYRNKFFNYPIKPLNTLKNLGLTTSAQIIASYLKSKAFPYSKENTFEEWVSNRFGKKLFQIFFKTYTEKLWGIPCHEIQAEWAAQRIKGLSLTTAIKNALFPDKSGKVKTLIEEFKYPKYGPGLMYEKMAENFIKLGGQMIKNAEVRQVIGENDQIKSVLVGAGNDVKEFFATNFLSSMPLTDLVKQIRPTVDLEVSQAAEKLTYRSFITVSLIFKTKNSFPDNWIYVHSPEVKLGRIQNFKNWSPYLVPNDELTSLGLEYFCTENDEFWNKKDEEIIKIGLAELEKIRLGSKKDFLTGFVARVPKAYPVYDQTYPENLKIIKNFLQKYPNLQPIGRYGMFKYNNMDHSILTGIYAAKNILGEKHNIWEINTDEEYHETKQN